MQRRDFLKMLGFGGAALTSLQFLPKLPFSFATNLEVIEEGPITPEWIAAQMMARLSEKLDYFRLHPLEFVGRDVKLGYAGLTKHRFVQLPFFDKAPLSWPRSKFAKDIIDTSAEKLAEELTILRPTRTGALEIPSFGAGIDHSYIVRDETTGLFARYLQTEVLYPLPFASWPLLNGFDIVIG